MVCICSAITHESILYECALELGREFRATQAWVWCMTDSWLPPASVPPSICTGFLPPCAYIAGVLMPATALLVLSFARACVCSSICLFAPLGVLFGLLRRFLFCVVFPCSLPFEFGLVAFVFYWSLEKCIYRDAHTQIFRSSCVYSLWSFPWPWTLHPIT